MTSVGAVDASLAALFSAAPAANAASLKHWKDGLVEAKKPNQTSERKRIPNLPQPDSESGEDEDESSEEDNELEGPDSSDEDVSEAEDADEASEQEEGEEDDEIVSEKPSEPTESPKLKRKRAGRNDDDLEGRYMQQLMEEEAREAKKQRREQSGDDSIPQHVSVVESGDAQNGEDDDQIPVHESLTNGDIEIEKEKASRTVYLGNVSIEAIRDKTAKKTLVKHVSSFLPGLDVKSGPHKFESIRFRSTAFASSAGPKRAAYAKQELMDTTTKSTNAYVVYSTPVAAREAVKRLNATIVLDRHLRVDGVAHPSKTDHRRCVFVGNLDFVDDDSAIKAASNHDEEKRPKKSKQAGDVEEGLWRQFGKAGEVESVRVVRDKDTRVGKGFAYVQFENGNSVEKALLFNDKKFPPLLPRTLRVTRAKSITKTASHANGRREDSKRSKRDANPKSAGSGYQRKITDEEKSAMGRAGKLLGRAGAAKVRHAGGQEGNRESKVPGGIRKPEDFVFEGTRAVASQKAKALALGKKNSRGAKRAASFRKNGGREKR